MPALILSKPVKLKAADDFWVTVDKTLRYHGNQIRKGIRGLWWDHYRSFADRPLFVVGCSRAGTTLVYRTFTEAREIGSLKARDS